MFTALLFLIGLGPERNLLQKNMMFLLETMSSFCAILTCYKVLIVSHTIAVISRGLGKTERFPVLR